MIAIVFAALCYLVGQLGLEATVTRAVQVVLAVLGLGLFALCLLHVAISLPACFG